MLSLGTYPDVTLKQASQRRYEIRRQLNVGIDSSAARKAEQASAQGADSFETLAREWFGKLSATWSDSYAVKITGHLNNDLIPWLGTRPVRAILAPELLTVTRRIESRGALETAHRALQTCGRIFRYAVATGRSERDPTGDLHGALPLARNQHFATLTDPQDIGRLLRTLDGYTGTFIVKHYGWLPGCSCALANCVKRNGLKSIWTARNGGYPPSR
jgi:integrase